ncbi:MAG TPA: ferrous iron transporter B, partial [Candidatus Korarchaeota archaeon]|nr:ferrous iron transporter B [Candidatus Korarchaeota archaeon]
PAGQAAVLVGLYAVQVALYLLTALVMNRLIFKTSVAPDLLLEIPPYHTPSLKVAWWYARTNSLHFLKKAGTVIFGANLAFWILLHLSPGGFVGGEEIPVTSIGVLLGRALQPIGALFGLGDWRVILALISGFIAREAVLTTLAAVTGVGDPLQAVSALGLTPAQALSLAILSMAYTPCAATLAVIKQEVRLIGLVIKQLVYQLAVAVALATAVYWGAVLLGLS